MTQPTAPTHAFPPASGHPQGAHPMHQPRPAGPPPQQFGAPSHTGRARPKGASTIWTLGLASLVAVVAGLSISEDGANAWHTVHAWGGLAVIGALLTLAPVALTSMAAQRAWQLSACGAGALVLFWVLFVLPAAGSNTSLVTTVGVALGAIATWISPGRENPAGR